MSLRTFIALVFLLCAFFAVYFETKNVIFSNAKVSMSSIAGIIFYLSCFCGYVFLFKITMQLPSLMVCWMKTEIELNNALQPPPTKWPLKKRINVLVSVYLALASAEHMLAVSTEINGIAKDFAICEPTDVDLLATFIYRRMRFFVENLPFKYNHLAGLFIEYFNIAVTLTWNYFDLTIIVMSIGMSSMFEKLNYRIESLRHLIVDSEAWTEVRVDYVKVCELLRKVNDMFGVFVMFATATDGYFIVLQLLNIMK